MAPSDPAQVNDSLDPVEVRIHANPVPAADSRREVGDQGSLPCADLDKHVRAYVGCRLGGIEEPSNDVETIFPCLEGSNAQAAHAGLRAVTQQAIGPSPEEDRPLEVWQATRPLWEAWWNTVSDDYVVDLRPARIDREWRW